RSGDDVVGYLHPPAGPQFEIAVGDHQGVVVGTQCAEDEHGENIEQWGDHTARQQQSRRGRLSAGALRVRLRLAEGVRHGRCPLIVDQGDRVAAGSPTAPESHHYRPTGHPGDWKNVPQALYRSRSMNYILYTFNAHAVRSAMLAKVQRI